MAFPSISAADTQTGSVTSNSTTWALTYPTNCANGDLITACVASDGNQVAGTWPSGWVTVRFSAAGSAAALILAKKKSDGTETGSFNVTGLNSEQGPWRTMRIPAAQWEGTLGTGWDNGGSSSGSVTINSLFGTTGTDANPNPGSLDPFNWATEDTLWIAVSANDGTPTYTGFPTNYTQQDHSTSGGHSQSSGGAGGAGLGTAFRKNAASSEDPGTFTLSGADDWVAITIGIRPAAAAVFNTQKRNQTILRQAVNRAARY